MRKRWLSWAFAAVAGFVTCNQAVAQEAAPGAEQAEAAEELDDETGIFSLEVAPGGVDVDVNVDEDGELDIDVDVAQARAFQPGKYWIGVSVAPADEALRTQLGLGEGKGVVVVEVEKDSPAGKAGVQRHDVLLSLGDQPLGRVRDVMNAVEAAGERAVAVKLLRGGKEVTVEVTPQARPKEGDPGSFDYLAVPAPPGRPGEPFEFFGVRPGAVFRGEGRPFWRGLAAHELPENLSISITKTGKQPAKIRVQRDGESWETTEDKLDALPEDVRPHVQQMFGRPSMFALRAPGVELRTFGIGQRGARRIRPERVRPEMRREQMRRPSPVNSRRRMEEMSRQLEELRKSLEDLRATLPKDDDGQGAEKSDNP